MSYKLPLASVIAASCLCPTSYNCLLPLSRYKFPRPEQQPVGSLLSFFAGEIFQHFFARDIIFIFSSILGQRNPRNRKQAQHISSYLVCIFLSMLKMQEVAPATAANAQIPKILQLLPTELDSLLKTCTRPCCGFSDCIFCSSNQILEEQLSVAEILQRVL